MADYIVGIDYGHGETAAWVVPLNANNPIGLPMEGTSLRLRASNEVEDQKLPSVVYYDNVRTCPRKHEVPFHSG